MSMECTRCGQAIADGDARYRRRTPQGTDAHYCSLNCLTNTDEYDEAAVRGRLFDAIPAE